MNRRILGILAVLIGSVFVSPGAMAADELTASSPLVKSCEGCHGARGESRNGDIPRLNGQKSDYILARFRDFRDPKRNTPHANLMMGNRPISDSDAAALAQYFSRQTPSPRIGFGIQSQAGAEIFRHGAEPAIPPCATCHGPDGDGLGGTPRITGQHGAYLMQQLSAFNSAGRRGTVMNRHTWDMTQQQMDQISAYLSNN